jgi:hypothetical protein
MSRECFPALLLPLPPVPSPKPICPSRSLKRFDPKSLEPIQRFDFGLYQQTSANASGLTIKKTLTMKVTGKNKQFGR